MPARGVAPTVPGMTNTASRTARSEGLALAGLLLLCVVPVAPGIWRLANMASAPVITPDNARFMNDPLPAVVHIVTATLFLLLGTFQVSRAARRWSLTWHRLAGRVTAVLGVAGGLSGVWLTLAYWSITRDGPVLFGLRLLVGSAMAGCVALAVVRVLRRDLVGHRAWMVRGYAIGLAGGTQFFTHLPWIIQGDMPDKLGSTLAMSAGWLINLVFAEWHLRRPAARAAPVLLPKRVIANADDDTSALAA